MKKYNTFILEKTISVEIPIPKDVIGIAKAFHKAGKDLFVVGGAIRDFLQGKQPHDYDLVTNATPEESKQILKGWNVSDEQGKNFGVIRVYTDSEPLGHEIAVYRADVSKGRDVKGEDQKVEFGPNIGMKKDSERRDLTINALFYDINKKEIVDLVGGVKDIENGIIRSVGVPSERFAEDRLRILRVFRFAARTGGKIDETTSQAIKDDNRLNGISEKDDVSQERVHLEWEKVLEHAEKGGVQIVQSYIDLLSEYDMWEQMFPGLDIDPNIKVDSILNPIVFFELLKKTNVNSKRKILNKLKFPEKLINKIYFLQEYKSKTYYIETVYELAKLKERFHIDNDLISEFVKVQKLDKNFCESFLKYCDDGFVIDGNDLMEQGLKGKAVGDEKLRLEIERFKNEYLKQ